MTDIDLIRNLVVRAAQLGFLVGTNNAEISDEALNLIGVQLANLTLDVHIEES